MPRCILVDRRELEALRPRRLDQRSPLPGRRGISSPGFDHLGLLQDTRAEVYDLLEACKRYRDKDARVQIQEYEDSVYPQLTVHAFDATNRRMSAMVRGAEPPIGYVSAVGESYETCIGAIEVVLVAGEGAVV
jgi:hypothetical protein